MEIFPQNLRSSVGGKALSGQADTQILDELFAEFESSILPDEQISDTELSLEDAPTSAWLSGNPSELLHEITVTGPVANFLRSAETSPDVETVEQVAPIQIPTPTASSTSESELTAQPAIQLTNPQVVTTIGTAVRPALGDNAKLVENPKSEPVLLDSDGRHSLRPSADQPKQPNLAEITATPKPVVDETLTGSDLKTHIGGDPKTLIHDDIAMDSVPQKSVRAQEFYNVAANTTVNISTVEKISTDKSIAIVGDTFETISASKNIEAPSENTPRVNSVSVLTTQPAIQARISEQVVAAISSPSNDKIEIRLDPPELGRVRVTLTQSENGTLAQIVSEKSEVADLLRRNAALLTKELTKAGFENVSLDFQSNSERQPSNQQLGDDVSTYEIGLSSAATNDKPRSAYVANSDSLDRRI